MADKPELVMIDTMNAQKEQGTVVVRRDLIMMVEACTYEGTIQGVKSKGAQIFVQHIGGLLCPHDPDRVKAQFIDGAKRLGRTVQ